jgi:curved DNA-binding protein CbpA
VDRHSFTDYYEILQISPNAQAETIHRVYRLLAQMYHPDNTETGSAEAFTAVLEAYRVLSDPERRASYDVEHRSIAALRWKIFDQTESSHGIAGEKRKRNGILSLLYSKRMHEPSHPVLSIIDLEQLLGCPREHLELSLWYLRESGSIQRSDNGRYALTAQGLDKLEATMEQSPYVGAKMLNSPAASREHFAD